nr:DUF6232 family protein [Alkalihalobacillus sp. AL-G]
MLVSDTRLVVDDQVYPIRGITYIELETKEPSSPLGLILACAFFFMLGIFQGNIIISVISVMIGFLIIRAFSRSATSYTLLLDTASGKVEAFSDDEYEEVERIYKALNEAIVYRG